MMERKDVEELGARTLEDFLETPPERRNSYIVRVTSGTSGSQPLMIVSGFHPNVSVDMLFEGADRTLTCSGSLCARLANAWVMSRVPDTVAMRVMSIDANDVTPELETLLADYAPQSVVGLPSFVMRALQCVPEVARREVRQITCIGESYDAYLESALAKACPGARQSELYMANEVGGYIGVRLCGFLPRNHFHPAAGVAIEIHEPDSEGVGDIVVSKRVHYKDVEITSYRIGDIGRLAVERCPCGAMVTFALLGRSGVDYIKVAGALLRREEFDRVLALRPGLIDDYRVDVEKATTINAAGKAMLRLYRRSGPGTEALGREIADYVSQNVFVGVAKTYEDMVLLGVLEPLAFAWADAPFPRGHKDIKLRLIPAR